MKQISANTNASASAKGCDFQANAGLVIFLSVIEDVLALEVECVNEDFEILLRDDRKLVNMQAYS